MEIQCSTCKFWDKLGDNPSTGLCRYHAPMASAMDPLAEVSHMDAHWPRSTKEDWCGRWDRKVETPVDET